MGTATQDPTANPTFSIDPILEIEKDVRLSAVPATIRELREKWATEFTRANQLERENETLRAQVDAIASRDLRNLDDLTRLHESQQIMHAEAIAWRDDSISWWQAEAKRADANFLEMQGKYYRLLDDANKRDETYRDFATTERDLRAMLSSERHMRAKADHRVEGLTQLIENLLADDAIGADCPKCPGFGPESEDCDCFSGRVLR